jgi:hypothetical protein
MTKLKHSLLLLALMIVMISCKQDSIQVVSIEIQDYPVNRWEPEIDLESHKSGDVEIHRVNYLGEGYQIIYYHDISGKIRDYHFLQIDSTNYDQGFYKWKNDTTVIVMLSSSETKQEFKVELYPVRDLNSSGGVRLLDQD